jgi:actin-related protein
MATESESVVLDCGSGLVKAGFAANDTPRAVFPTVIGRAKPQTPSKPGSPLAPIAPDAKPYYIGADALAKHESVTLKVCV